MDGKKGIIKMYNGNECVSLSPGGNSNVKVTIKNTDKNKESVYTAKLVVGADGINSKVRN